MFVAYWFLTENYVLNANILVFMIIHTELFSNVSGLGLIHCGLEKNFGPRPRPRPHSFWPRPWPHAQLASLTSLSFVERDERIELGFLESELPSIYLTLGISKIRVHSSETLPQTPDLEDFATTFRSSKRAINLARQR